MAILLLTAGPDRPGIGTLMSTRTAVATAEEPNRLPKIEALDHLYLSGPMTGIAQFNYPAFFHVSALLRDVGYFVYNPAEHGEGAKFDVMNMTGNESPDVIDFDIRAAFADYSRYICTEADAIAVLPGWENSRGAKAEVALARGIGLPVVDATTGHIIEVAISAQVVNPVDSISLSTTTPIVGDSVHARPDNIVYVDPTSDSFADVLAPLGGEVFTPEPSKGGFYDPLRSGGMIGTMVDPYQVAKRANRPAPLRLFGLGGYAESGKDAFADLIVAHPGFAKTYMSKPLEQALLRLNPWINLTLPEYVERLGHPVVRYQALHEAVGYDLSKKEPEVRGLLQRLGTEVGREMFGENVWVDAMLKEAESLGGNVVVTGMRFRNEMDAVQSSGPTIWVDRGLPPVNSHASDNTLGPDDFDIIVDNTGTLEDLAAAADEFYRLVVLNHPITDSGCLYLTFNARRARKRSA
jgi:hypothetical protein